MKEFWEYFENLNEYVYVSDMDTYEIVYMNKKLREFQDTRAGSDNRQKKCYEMIGGCAEPCKLCKIDKLKEGCFEEWSYVNRALGRQLVKETMVEKDGRRYHVYFAIGAHETEPELNLDPDMLQSYESLEKLANEGVRLSLQAPTPDGSVDIILEYLGKVLAGERIYVFEQNEKGGDDNTYEWVAEGVTPEKDSLQDLPAEVCASWYEQFEEGRSIVIKDIEDIRLSDPLKYETLRRQNIHSLVVVPLFRDGKAIGFYGVDNPTGEYWERVTNILQMMSYFIIASLNRRSLIRRLEKMSYHDQLTGFQNRYAMWKYLGEIPKQQSLGVVYCDVTGLKKMNDTQGHEMGDKLICDCCGCIQKAFDGYGLFRIGGDELVVLASGITQEELKRREQQLEAYTEEKKVVLAIGSSWVDTCPKETESFLYGAEMRMYENKRAYYESHGIERRKFHE